MSLSLDPKSEDHCCPSVLTVKYLGILTPYNFVLSWFSSILNSGRKVSTHLTPGLSTPRKKRTTRTEKMVREYVGFSSTLPWSIWVLPYQKGSVHLVRHSSVQEKDLISSHLTQSVSASFPFRRWRDPSLHFVNETGTSGNRRYHSRDRSITPH